MRRQYELLEKVRTYNKNTNETLINKAYVFAMLAHGKQERANGDPYFSHPIEVAFILTDLKMDDDSIITALLHDTIEDTKVTRNDIALEFGETIASLVDGVTKLTKLEIEEIYSNPTENEKQAENFRKLLIAVADDIRVLLVKLADRLHNMRTLHYVKKQTSQIRIARETEELYAPLAGRIGVYSIQEELEDLCFKILNPEARDSIISRLEKLKKENRDLLKTLEDKIIGVFKKNKLTCNVTGRIKSPYSIYQKMRRKDLAFEQFEQLADVIGFRVLTETVDECYQALGIMHREFSHIPGRFKDFISLPKRNGYRSLHTAVILKEHKVELQIRTKEFHELAEKGVAAHWYYKKETETTPMQYQWIRELVDSMKNGQASELLEYTKMEIFSDQVFCFTPKGRIIRLPRGATAIDFAYAVHSNIGDKCIGVKINSMTMPFRALVQNGDTIEILINPQAKPSKTWEAFAITAKAKNHIRRYLRTEERDQYVKLGESILKSEVLALKKELNDAVMEKFLQTTKIFEPTELYWQIGHGKINCSKLVSDTFPDAISIKTPENKLIKKMPITGMIPGIAVHLGQCCYPILGDRILGIFQEDKGIQVHAIDCDALASYDAYPELWIDLKWDKEENSDNQFDRSVYTTRIGLDIKNTPGCLGKIATLIGEHNGNIINLTVTERKLDFVKLYIDLEVYDLLHLQNILNAIKDFEYIKNVERVRDHKLAYHTNHNTIS